MDGMVNRTYDLSNPHDLKDALLHMTGAYLGYYHCWQQMVNLVEDFDEALENSDFSSWMSLGGAPGKADELTSDAAASLRASDDLLTKVMDRAREYLSFVLKAALTAPPDIQMMVWEVVYDVPAEKIDGLLENLFDEVAEGAHMDDSDDESAAFILLFHQLMEPYR